MTEPTNVPRCDECGERLQAADAGVTVSRVRLTGSGHPLWMREMLCGSCYARTKNGEPHD